MIATSPACVCPCMQSATPHRGRRPRSVEIIKRPSLAYKIFVNGKCSHYSGDLVWLKNTHPILLCSGILGSELFKKNQLIYELLLLCTDIPCSDLYKKNYLHYKLILLCIDILRSILYIKKP